jgi:DNA-binding SARP family transcriptional activator/regulation of enolase protein 1 (concanavalin A-like superfamily)
MAPASAPKVGPTEPGGPYSIHLLGRFLLIWEGKPVLRLRTKKTEYLFAYLAMRPDHVHEREILAGTFWPDVEEKKARDGLAKAIQFIRQDLKLERDGSEPVIESTNHGVRFVGPTGCEVDVLQFEQYARRGLEAGLGVQERIEVLETAVGYYYGQLLPGCDYEWFENRRLHLETRHEECLRALIEASKTLRQPARVIKWARALLQVDPFDEECHREVMRQCRATVDRGGVIQQYEECCRILAAEDLEPSPETVALYHELLKPAPDPPPLDPHRPSEHLELVGPLTGRESEMQRLWRAWVATGHGVGGLVFLSGDAGIGKSRLGKELLQLVEAAEALPVYAQGYHMERGLLYQPLVDALGRTIEVADRLGLELGTPPVLSHVARLVPALRNRFLDLEPAGSGEERDLFDALCRFFLDLARQRRLCLFLDDLQWADDATLRFLHYLWRRAAGAPLLLVGAFREAEAKENTLLVRWRREVEAQHPDARLALPRLSEAAVRELLERLAGENAPLPDGMAPWLHRETKGNPLFLLMTIRSLFEQQILTRDEDGVWKPGSALKPKLGPKGELVSKEVLEQLPLSSTIREWILERLERLGEPERRLLEAAAVLGQSFDYESVTQVAGQAAEEAVPVVERLLEVDLLREEVPGKLGFYHDRVREVVYGRLFLPRRQALHQRAGELLEAQWGPAAETRAAELADHFLKGLQPRGTEPALRYLIKAGVAARRLRANAEAMRHLETALELLDTLPEDESHGALRCDAVHELSRVYRAQGETERGEALLIDFIQRCRLNVAPLPEAQGARSLAGFLWLGHSAPRNLARIEALYERALSLCARHGLDEWSVKPRTDLLLFYMAVSPDPTGAARLAEGLTRDLDRFPPQDAQEALTLLMGFHGAQGRWEEAHAAFCRSLDYGGPILLTFHLVLGWLEQRAEREGTRERFATLCEDWHARALAIGVRNLPVQWYLMPAEPAPGERRLFLDVDCTREAPPAEMFWVDPLQIARPVHVRGDGLRFAPPQGAELWSHTNLNAPRLMVEVRGDFVAETRVELGETSSVQAGLLLWAGEKDFVRLERVRSRSHADGVNLEAETDHQFRCLGRGSFTSRAVWLRLERQGSQVRGLCSADRQQWWACGSGSFVSDDVVQVGMACVVQEPGASACFKRFTVWNSGEGGNGRG